MWLQRANTLYINQVVQGYIQCEYKKYQWVFRVPDLICEYDREQNTKTKYQSEMHSLTNVIQINNKKRVFI